MTKGSPQLNAESHLETYTLCASETEGETRAVSHTQECLQLNLAGGTALVRAVHFFTLSILFFSFLLSINAQSGPC